MIVKRLLQRSSATVVAGSATSGDRSCPVDARAKRSLIPGFAAVCLAMLGAHHDAAWAGPMVTWQGISLVNISQASEFLVTGVPQVAVSRVDPNLIAVAWRKYGLPINTNAGANPGERTADCHVAVSTDGGQTFTDTDLMPILRQRTDPEMPTQPEPGLFYCNWPWVSIGDDRTI